MTWQYLMLHANAMICLLIMFRLLFFNKAGKAHRLGVSVFAYLIPPGIPRSGSSTAIICRLTPANS